MTLDTTYRVTQVSWNLTRNGADGSEALSFRTFCTIGSLAGDAYSVFHDLNGTQKTLERTAR